MKSSGMLRVVICLALSLLLIGCISFPALKNISPEVKAGFKRVGVVVLVSDIVPSYELTREKDFWGYEIKIAAGSSAFRMASGALDQAVTEAVSSRLGSGVTVIAIPTTQDEKEIYWEGIEGLSYLARKNRLLDRLSQVSTQDNLDLIVLVRQYHSEPEPLLRGREIFGLVHTYLANKDRSGGSYNIMTAMVVELLDGKSLKSLDLKHVFNSPGLPPSETQIGWKESVSGQENPAVSRNVALGVGKRVASALERLGF